MSSQNISCFPTSCIYTLNHRPPRSTRYLPFFLTSLSTLYSLYKAISISWSFPIMTWNIYRDISNNFLYSIRKSNITIIYQLRKYCVQYSLQMESLLIRNSIHFPTISTLEQIPLSQFFIYLWWTPFVSHPDKRAFNSTFNWNSFCLCCMLYSLWLFQRSSIHSSNTNLLCQQKL